MNQQEETKDSVQVERDMSNRLEFDTDRNKDILDRVKELLNKE